MSAGVVYKRKQYLVDRRYQVAFMLRVFLVVLAVTAASSIISAFLLWRAMAFPGPGLHLALLTAAFIAVGIILLLELCLAIPFIYVLGLRQSHRTIGPVDRFKRVLTDIGKGDFTQRVRLRATDDLDELAASINQMAESLQRRFSRDGS